MNGTFDGSFPCLGISTITATTAAARDIDIDNVARMVGRLKAFSTEHAGVVERAGSNFKLVLAEEGEI